MKNLDIVRQAVELSRQAGADQAEAFLYRNRVLTAEVSNGQVETVKQAEDIGIALRARVGNRMGLSYATDFDPGSLNRAAARAVEIAHAADEDEHLTLPEHTGVYPDVQVYDPEMNQHSIEEKIDRALAIEKAAKAFDARVVLARRVTYSDREFERAIGNSLGLAAERNGNSCSGVAMVVARQGTEQQMGFGFDTRRRYAELDTRAIGEEAAENAVSVLGAVVAPTQRASILLEPKMAGSFLAIIANLVCADNVQKNKSLLAGKLGQRVAAPGVSIVDDGMHPDAPGLRAWDDEGVASQRTPVIADGTLQNYLHSSSTAHKAHTRSTGNAERASFKMPPGVSSSNMMLLPGKESAEALRAGITRGLVVKQLMNLHTANPISGEFSFGATGLWVENGQVTGPVRGVTISGNLTELLTNVRGVGNDMRWMGFMGVSIGAPSLLIEDVSIAGK